MLHDLQTAMGEQILNGWPELPPGISGGTIPAAVRFAIYADNVVGSLVEALEAAFPMTARLLGHRAFRSAAVRFVRRRPPAVPQLIAYGADFPDALERMAPDPAPAADLARFEWAWNSAYFAADAPILDPAALSLLPPDCYPSLRLTLHPSARLLVCRYPVLDLWQNLRRDADAVPPVPPAATQRVLVVRPSLEVQAMALGRSDLILLRALAAGAALGDAAEAVLDRDECFDLQASLIVHLRLGTFTAFIVE
jgi:hypothetical protein